MLNAILFTRVGNDYQTSGNDARITAEATNLPLVDGVLTVESLLFRAVRDVLIDCGHRVAVQTGDVIRYTPNDGDVSAGYDFGLGMTDEFEDDEPVSKPRQKELFA